jgi:hypothetical protein
MKKMKRLKYILPVSIWIISLGLSACKYYSGDKSLTGIVIENNSSVARQQTNSALKDSLTMQKDELAKIYTQAIAEFIKAAYKKDKTKFDTLYFGKHIYGQPDDFPDIELPETIEKTQIRLVAPEVGQKIQLARKSLVYVNLMSWVDKENAEFIFVVFTNGSEHQFDYFLNFNYNTSSDKFELNNIEFENYLHLNGQKPKRIMIYKDGKYSGDI